MDGKDAGWYELRHRESKGMDFLGHDHSTRETERVGRWEVGIHGESTDQCRPKFGIIRVEAKYSLKRSIILKFQAMESFRPPTNRCGSGPLERSL